MYCAKRASPFFILVQNASTSFIPNLGFLGFFRKLVNYTHNCTVVLCNFNFTIVPYQQGLVASSLIPRKYEYRLITLQVLGSGFRQDSTHALCWLIACLDYRDANKQINQSFMTIILSMIYYRPNLRIFLPNWIFQIYCRSHAGIISIHSQTTITVWRVISWVLIFVESPKKPLKSIFVVLNFVTATSPGAWHCMHKQ